MSKNSRDIKTFVSCVLINVAGAMWIKCQPMHKLYCKNLKFRDLAQIDFIFILFHSLILECPAKLFANLGDSPTTNYKIDEQHVLFAN